MFRAIKTDSPTGFFRNPNNPNRRTQDGDKLPLLCTECEGKFCKAERKFANDVFRAFHNDDRNEFAYGPWLHYFLTSLAWRTLILDLPGLDADAANPRASIAELASAANTMRAYLRGSDHLGSELRIHAVAWTRAHEASAALAAVGPNVLIRRSVFGYTVLNRDRGYSGVLHNLGGFMSFLIVHGDPRDSWCGTKIAPEGGQICQPQRARSWLVHELLSDLIRASQDQDQMSAVQQQKIDRDIRGNLSAPALRFVERDRQIRKSD